MVQRSRTKQSLEDTGRTNGGAGSGDGRGGPALQFRAIRSARAFEEIAGQIRTELEEGRLRVGNRLPSERALAEQFGVSRNTLREALRALENAGLLRLQKGSTGGAFISEQTAAAVGTGLMDMYHLGAISPEHLTEARIWLESVIVREACERATQEDIDRLNANIDEVERALHEGDFQLRAEKHVEFHRLLARMTGNPIMVVVMDSVLSVLAHFIRKIGNYNNDFVLPSRRRFMKFLAEGDTNAAVAEMEASLKRLQRNYLARVRPDPAAREDEHAQERPHVEPEAPATPAPPRRRAAARKATTPSRRVRAKA